MFLKRKAENNGANGTPTVQAVAPKNGAMPNSQAFDDKKKEDAVKKVEVAGVTNGQVAEASKPQSEPVNADSTKQEVKPIVAEKPALNLEGTLKLVEELHRRKIHRDNLLSTINTLDGFKVLIQDESRDIESAQFQGCKLIIEDDDRNSFSTKNPAIIKAVAEYVNKLCVDKLAEIEANIVIPV